jgi:aryl-alcohol dehydrogenase-like predicted oxidoreductase
MNRLHSSTVRLARRPLRTLMSGDGALLVACGPSSRGRSAGVGGGQADRAAHLTDGDWRSRSSELTGEGLRRNPAVAWALPWSGVTGAIVGERSPEQVGGWLAAASLDLTDENQGAVAAAIGLTGAGEGPAAPAVRA